MVKKAWQTLMRPKGTSSQPKLGIILYFISQSAKKLFFSTLRSNANSAETLTHAQKRNP